MRDEPSESERLAVQRPAQRHSSVTTALTEDAARLRATTRPGRIRCFVAATDDGACVVVPIAVGDVTSRAQRLLSAAAGALAAAADLAPPLDGRDALLEGAAWEGSAAIRLGCPDGAGVAELFELALAEQGGSLDRVDPAAVLVPAGAFDDTVPAVAHWLWRAEMAARLGGMAGAARMAPEVEAALGQLAGTRPTPEDETDEASAAHDDPLPARRVVRRILRRLDGMGKYGGYHTDIRHLARGFAGNDRRLALAAGEALIRAGLLDEKPSVGQRHVALVASRTADIRRLVEDGTTDDGTLAAFLERS